MREVESKEREDPEGECVKLRAKPLPECVTLRAKREGIPLGAPFGAYRAPRGFAPGAPRSMVSI